MRPVRVEHAKRGNDATVDLDEGVFVACAGLVLLHPFLPQLFGALGIAKDDRLVDPERALGLLHHLSTGQSFAPEYDLLLPKLLCSLPLDTPVDFRIALTAAEEEEADALLAAVIRHWDALGDTSVDGLRGSFLVRPGKLSRRGRRRCAAGRSPILRHPAGSAALGHRNDTAALDGKASCGLSGGSEADGRSTAGR